jgi:hypothetical protein
MGKRELVLEVEGEPLAGDLRTFVKRREWKQFLIRASFIPLKIRILRLLI